MGKKNETIFLIRIPDITFNIKHSMSGTYDIG